MRWRFEKWFIGFGFGIGIGFGFGFRVDDRNIWDQGIGDIVRFVNHARRWGVGFSHYSLVESLQETCNGSAACISCPCLKQACIIVVTLAYSLYMYHCS